MTNRVTVAAMILTRARCDAEYQRNKRLCRICQSLIRTIRHYAENVNLLEYFQVEISACLAGSKWGKL